MRRRHLFIGPYSRKRLAVSAGLGALLLISGCTPPGIRTPDGRPDGAKIYQVYCSGCHGPDGRRGDPRSHLTDAATTPTEDLRAIIERGGDGMPAWKKKLAADEIEAVIGYIRTLGGKPAPGS